MTPEQFRDDIIEVAIQGYNDIDGRLELKTLEDLLAHLNDVTVYEEFAWAVTNVIENVMNDYLSRYPGIKGEVSSHYALESTFVYTSINPQILGAECTVTYLEGMFEGSKRMILHNGYQLSVSNFYNDDVVQVVITQIEKSTKQQIEQLLGESRDEGNI